MIRKMKLSELNRDNGFTLVELMIGMTMLGLIMLLLFSSLHMTGKSWSLAQKKIDRTDELRIATNFITTRIQQAIPIVWMDKRQREIAFKGMADEINFVSSLPAHRGGGGLHLLALKLIEEDHQKKLVLQYQSAITTKQSFDAFASGSPESIVVAENINKLEFTYFGKPDAKKDSRWNDEWSSTEQLPQIVRVSISSYEPKQNWPELNIIIRPRYVNGQTQFTQYPQTGNI